MTYGPPENQPPGQPPQGDPYGQPQGGYGPQQGGYPQQPGGYGPPQSPPPGDQPPGPPPPGAQGPQGAQPPAYDPQGAQPAPGQPAPYGAPAQYGAASQYGTPAHPGGPGQYGPAAKGFDPKSVSVLDWAALAAGLLAFIFSFISYYTAGLDTSGSCPAGLQDVFQREVGSDSSATAWHGFFGWFGVILALVGAGLVALAVFAPQVKLPFPTRLAAAGAFALGVISTLLALVVDPIDTPGKQTIAGCTIEAVIGHGFGYWATLIVIAAGAVVTFLAFQQGGGQLPGMGGARGGSPGNAAQTGYPAPSSGGYGQPPTSGYGQPPAGGYGPPSGSAYGQPPAGSGYPPPQPPPPGPGYPPPQPPPGYPPPAQ